MNVRKKIGPLSCIILLTVISFTANAQRGISGLVSAEKEFADYTASHTIREGFLRYMDSTGVVFQRANPVNAITAYQKQKPGPGVLNWKPVFAVISASGDMGITTGPYEFRASATDTATGRGSFSSVWQLNSDGVWKNIVDLGTSYEVIPAASDAVQELVLPGSQPEGYTYEDLLAMDQQLNSIINKKNIIALPHFFPADSRLNRDDHLPVTGTAAVVAGLGDFGRAAVLVPITGALSNSKDLAWFYGSVISGTRKENYLRVWIFRNGRWSVIFQTIKG